MIERHGLRDISTGRGNATRMLDEECFHQLATESCQGTPLIVNQDRNPNFKRATGKSSCCISGHEGQASGRWSAT